jgi:tetratricopeptide (TPR) repeat protein
MGKDPRENAEKQQKKAERFFELSQYRKAGKVFNDAGSLFLNLHDFDQATDCFYAAAQAFSKNEKISPMINALRYAGDASLYQNEFSEANQFFKNVIKYIPHLKTPSERDSQTVLFSALSYLCLFIKGKQDQGLEFLKQIKKKVDSNYFKENPLIRLVKNLTIAVRDKNQSYLDRVEEEFENYKFREAEGTLMKKVLVLAKTHISLITELRLDKAQYTTKETMNLTLDIDTTPLLEISKYPFYNYEIKKLEILNAGISLSDNLITSKKPDLPLPLKPGQKDKLKFEIKSHFQVDKSFIGPILLTCKLDEHFIFYLKTQTIMPNLISPPATLDISLKNLRTPLIDQTFPMEIQLKNNGKGEAFQINIEVSFPEQLKMMRGTTKKQIFSLRSNEDIKWEINLKPVEAGDHEIKFQIKFSDADQNEIDEVKTFPLSIKL